MFVDNCTERPLKKVIACNDGALAQIWAGKAYGTEGPSESRGTDT